MFQAARDGDVEMAKKLIKAGANVNEKGWEGRTPLHDATLCGSAEVAKVLIKFGTNVGAKNQKGAIPLGVAFGTGRGKELERVLSDPEVREILFGTQQAKTKKALETMKISK